MKKIIYIYIWAWLMENGMQKPYVHWVFMYLIWQQDS